VQFELTAVCARGGQLLGRFDSGRIIHRGRRRRKFSTKQSSEWHAARACHQQRDASAHSDNQCDIEIAIGIVNLCGGCWNRENKQKVGTRNQSPQTICRNEKTGEKYDHEMKTPLGV
jgi:hypothetical protein